MKIFLDSANVDEVREAVTWGILDGITTNPASVAAQRDQSLEEILSEFVGLTDGPISAQVVAESWEEMIEQGINLAKIAPNILVKIPAGMAGFQAMRRLSELDISTHCTLVFNPVQALLAAKAGATFVSPFVGRLDANGQSGMEVVGQIVTIFDNYGFESEIMVASIKHPMHVIEAAVQGADACTMPFELLKGLADHPLTEAMKDRFMRDWKKRK